MLPRPIPPKPPDTGVDRRIWTAIFFIGLMAYIVTKDVRLPPPVILGAGVLGLLGLFMTGLQSPEFVFYALLAYLPFSRVLLGGFGANAYAVNMTNLLVGIVLVCFLSKRSADRPGGAMKGGEALTVLIGLFMLSGTFSLAKAGFDFGSWYFFELFTSLKRWLTPVGLYFLTLWVVRDKKMLKTAVVIMMVVVTVTALMAIRDYMNAGDTSLENSRVGGIAEQPNTLGAFFVYYMFLFLGFFLIYFRRAKAWWLLIPFLICFRGIMVTFSRGAYLGFAAGVFSGCFFRNKGLFLALLTLTSIIVMDPNLIPAGIRYRSGQTVEKSRAFYYAEDITETLEASARQRIEIWRGAVEMIKDKPWFGVGYGAFPAFLPYYTNGAVGRRDAHNSYLLIAAEMGLPTLLLFLITLLVAMYYGAWLYRRTQDQMIKAIALGFLSGMGGLLVVNMFGSRMDDQAISSYFWILCALIMRGIALEQATGAAEPASRPGSTLPRGPRAQTARGGLPAGEWERRQRLLRGGS